jgi:hypothetical protein
MTKGWKLLIPWKGGSFTWVPLKDLLESHPVQVAKYAHANKLLLEPSFAWWAKKALRRRDWILIKTLWYWMHMHKYGIHQLPKPVNRVLHRDEETGTDLW